MVEEAPAPAVESGLVKWDELLEAAVAITSKAEYRNLGTVEFIVDPSTGRFYFLEVNTRLQVEHPVTEACTGLDLVALQIRIAEGERLGLSAALSAGDRSAVAGHAIEVRVLAEDPTSGFRPSVGKILKWSFRERPGVRIDTGFRSGSEISAYYDSLVAKVIAHGADRSAAIAKLKLALEEFHVLGVSTNVGFLLDLLSAPAFVSGEFHTGTLGEFIESWVPPGVPEEVLALSEVKVGAASGRVAGKRNDPAWGLLDGFRVG
jgi:acetyl/propionyl-CoA carboxylase alpha subunit